MLLRPRLLEPPDGRGRQPAGVLAEQCDQGFLKVAGRQALEVEDRDQHFEAFRAARVRRQNRRRKADALRTFTGTVTYTRAAHGDRTDAGHNLALGQMPVAHQPLATVIGQLVGMAGEQDCDFGLHRLRQQRSRAVAQNLGQRVRKSSWLAELENVSVGHGVSLLRWRSGGVKHPHDTPPYPFMPSPTFAYSSRATLPPYKRASLAQSPVDVRSRARLAPVFRFGWRIGFGLLFFGRRGAASCAAVAAVSACLRAIAARHFAGWTLRSARNCRFSASLNVASYARRARASYRQATSAKTANAIGTTRGIMRQAITMLGPWRTAYGRRRAVKSTPAGPAARRSNACPSATRSDGGMP